MKKILTALTLVAFGYISAEAQGTVACGKPEGKVCTKKGCYKTKYAENYKVCKAAYGYYICCEEPNGTNSTFPPLPLAQVNKYKNNEQVQPVQNQKDGEYTGIDPRLIAPQSQSYPEYSAHVAISYQGYYPKKNRIRVCSNSDNVAEENREAYMGCPTPAYDGPEKNAQRNVNYTNPNESYPQPDIEGNRQ